MTGPLVRVGDIAEQIRGVTFAKPESVTEPTAGYVPVLRAGNIQETGLDFGDLVYVPADRVRDKQRVRENDVVIAASSGSLDVVGKAARSLANFEGGFGAFCKVLRPGPNVDPSYFAHYFKTPEYRRKVSSLAEGANINNLKNEHLNDLLIPLPPLEDQRRIAAILDQADALRTKRRHSVAALTGLSRAVYAEMLPSDAALVTLESALSSAAIFTDGDWVESKDQDPAGEVRLTQLADVGDGFWLDKSFRFLTAQKAAELRCTYLRRGDVLVARMPDPLGRACVFPGEEQPCVTVVDVCVIRPDPESHTPEWLAACINSGAVRTQIARLATGTTRSRVSRGNLKKVLIPEVSLRVQEEFSRTVAQIAALRRSLTVADKTESDLVLSLASRAFRGEL